jgi:hypothetical protein
MRNQFRNPVCVAVDMEVESPVAGDTGLPSAVCFIEFFRMEREMLDVSRQEV